MNLYLQHISKLETRNSKLEIKITGSKSETNRLLLLQALYPNLQLENTSVSDDSEVMMQALQVNLQLETLNSEPIDIHHAGTAMRFLTAYFAIKQGSEIVLTGSSRMKERPIKILVDALKQIGADIEYVENNGFPPLKIIGKKLTQIKVSLPANVSSQYISALLLIAPKLENGLELTLTGEITSMPYIQMTLALLTQIGVATSFEGNIISVLPKPKTDKLQPIIIESDWSSASYFYSIVALSEIGTEIKLSSFKPNSLQGDAVLVDIYKELGVQTVFNADNSILIKKIKIQTPESIICNLQSSPDIAQTIAVTCFGLEIDCQLTGLHTLKIKETDRLEALKTELSNLGANISVTNDCLTLAKTSPPLEGCPKGGVVDHEVKCIATYQDHRMALAFAPLALKSDLIIQDADVVTKSYPNFWKDLESIGFKIEQC